MADVTSGAVEVGTAYVSVLPSTKGFNKAIDSSLSGAGSGVGAKIGTKIDSGISKVLKTGVAATGVAVGGILGASITKGLGRLNAIEQAKVKFEALGHSAKQQESLMKDVTAAVKGTAFSTSEAADAAAMALAGGIKPGKELTGVLKTVGDAASFANKPFGDVAPIFTKAINQGKVMGDTLMQLEENAIPATQSLAKHLGKTATEIKDMASKGEISFTDLQAAMDASIGGQALKAGETFTGSLANIGAAMARFGEVLLSPVFESSPAIFNSLGGVFDSLVDALSPASEQIGNILQPALADVADLIETRLAPAVGAGAEKFGELAVKLAEAAVDPANWQWVAQAFESVADSARNAGPAIGELVGVLARIGAVVSVHVWVAFANVLEALVPIIENVLVPVLNQVADLAEKHPGLVQGMVMAWMGMKVVKGVAGPFKAVTGAIGKASTAAKGFGEAMKVQKSLAAMGGKNVGTLGSAFGVLGTKISPVITKLKNVGTVAAGVGPKLAGALKGVSGGAASGIGAAFSGIGAKLAPMFAKLTPILKPVTSAFAKLAPVFSKIGGAIARFAPWLVKLAPQLLRFVPIIGWIVTAGTALWAFFTKTEIGRKIWDGLMEKLSEAWQWVQSTFAPVWEWLGGVISTVWDGVKTAFTTFVDFLKVAWESYIKPVFDAFMLAAKFLAAIILTVLIAPFIIAWNLLSMVISAAWTNIIKPVWDAFAAVVTWLWTTVLMPIFEFIKTAFMLVATTLFTIWSTVIKVVWDAFAAAVTWIWNTIIMPIFNLIKLAFQAVGLVFQFVWNSIIKPAWDALGAGISWVWNTIVNPVWNAMKAGLSALGMFFQMVWNNIIKPAWDALGAGIGWVVDNIVRPAFERIKSALSSVKDFFSTVVDGIRTIWDALKGHVARPINFVIDTVWNNGLVAAWNTIAGFLPGLPEATPLARIGGYATGGAVFGPGTATSDSILARLSAGEHVLTAADVKALGGHDMIYALRALIKRGEPFSWDMATGLSQRPKDAIDKFASERGRGDIGLMPGFKDGGAVARRAIRKDDTRPAWKDQLVNGHKAAMGRDGNPYTWGFEDCSGYMSAIADAIINGGYGSWKWATGSFPGGQPWEPGLSEGFSVGVHDNPGGPGGGHTAGTLSAVDNFSATNVESGGGHGYVAYGGPAAGADDPQWDGVSPGRYHLAIGADGSFESAGGPSPEKQRAILKQKIQEIIDKAMDPIADAMGAAIGEPPPHWLGIPPAALDKTKEGALDTAFEFVDNLGDKLRAAYDLAKDVVSSVTTVVRNIIPGFAEGGAVTGLWRDNGGMIPTGQSVVTNETGKPEAVLNWKQVDRIRDILASLKSIDEFKKLAEILGGMVQSGIYDPRASQFGITGEDDELVKALWFSRDEWFKSAVELDKIMRGAAEKAATGYRDEALDFFGFKDIFDTATEIHDAFNPSKSAVSDVAVSTDPGYSTTSGKLSTGQELVYGDPNITFESTEVELETVMPDLDSAGTPGSGPVKDQVKAAFKPKGWDSGPMWDAADWIIGKESGWDPMATNASSGAFGLFQFNPASGTLQKYLPDKNPNPKIQGEAGARYISDRYGDPLKAKAFWERNGWYDKGGWLMPGLTLTNNETGKPEAVLNPAQWAKITRQTDLVAEMAENRSQGAPLVVIEKLEARDESAAMRAATREANRVSRSAALTGGW